MPIAVATQFNACVYDPSLSGIAGSKIACGMNVCLL
jgi:hypothetical protein